MGLLLLCLGNLAVTLLATATVVALAARWRRRWLAVGVPSLVALGLFGLYAGLAVLAGAFWRNAGMALAPLCFLLALTLLFGAGCFWLIVAGLRRGQSGSRRTATWPVCRLAALLGVAIILHLATWWGLELAAEQRTAALRAESNLLILAAAPAPVPDHDNAASSYSQATDALRSAMQMPLGSFHNWQGWVSRSAAGCPDRTDRERLDTNDAKLRAFLKEQADTIALLHKGANKRSCAFGRPYDQRSLGDVAPETYFLRDAATLLALDARCKAADGDARGAMRDCRATFAIARHVAGDRTLISLFYSIGVQEFAVDAMKDVLETAPPTAADLAELDDLDDFSYYQALRRALRMEEALGCQAFCDVGEVLVHCGSLGSGSEPLGHGWWIVPYNIFLRKEDIEIFHTLIGGQQRFADVPCYQYAAEWQEAARQAYETKARARHGYLAPMIAPSHLGYQVHAITADAKRRLAVTAVAVCRFRAARGRLPNAIADLVPQFLAAVPRDPFDGRPLRMKKTGENLVVYSIGEDGKDDGGIPWNLQKQAGDITFTIKVIPQ